VFGLRRITFGAKLYGSFGALLLLVAVLGGLALTTIRSLGGSLDYAVNSSAKKATLIAAMHTGIVEMRVHAALAEISLLNTKIAAGALGMVSGTECSSCHTLDRVDANRQEFETVAARVTHEADEIRKFPLSSKERQALDTLASGVASWTSLYRRYLSLGEQKDFPQGHDIMVDRVYPLVATLDQATDALAQEQKSAMGSLQADSARQAVASLWRVAAAAVLALAAGFGGMLLVRLAGRTLGLRADALLEMSREVATAAGEISQSNQALAQSASQQAASIQQTSAATSDIHGHTRQNLELARSAAEAMSAEAEAATEADGKLNEALGSMHEMVADSDRISRIIKTIDQIAFQTNILALNAAVEAARAGESGLGFSVVADEVRNLARRSADAAKETADLVSSSVASSAAASARLEDVTNLVRAMTGRITAVKRQIDELNDSGRQQATGLDQIARSVSEMEQLTAASAAQAQERLTASQQLSDALSSQSAALSDVVDGLRSMF
jgi:methyl-accepting chemotaxis protein/methyl-accepting chemotaxis protein-1 (serine sensor receptor)